MEPSAYRQPRNPWLVWLGRITLTLLAAGVGLTLLLYFAPSSGAWYGLFMLGPLLVMLGLLLGLVWSVVGAVLWQLHKRSR